MKDWKCVSCGHEVVAADKPAPIRWTDGHVCEFADAAAVDGRDVFRRWSAGTLNTPLSEVEVKNFAHYMRHGL